MSVPDAYLEDAVEQLGRGRDELADVEKELLL